MIIDEISMANKATFFCASQVFAHIRSENGINDLHAPFGRANVILCGDFHQFPPVGNSSGVLYNQSNKDRNLATIGQSLYQQFNTVIMPTEQKCVQDPVWAELLLHLRTGDCTTDDLEEINKLVVGNPLSPQIDYSKPPWNDAILVTPRHSVQQRWNEEAIKKHCALTGQRRYIFPTEDTYRDSSENLSMEARLAIAKLNDNQTGKLCNQITVAIGMKAMVVLNLATKADIANGTRGTIIDIVLNPREILPETETNGTVCLKYPPAAVLFKPKGKCSIGFKGRAGERGLDEGIIPIVPSVAPFTIDIKGKSYGIRR